MKPALMLTLTLYVTGLLAGIYFVFTTGFGVILNNAEETENLSTNETQEAKPPIQANATYNESLIITTNHEDSTIVVQIRDAINPASGTAYQDNHALQNSTAQIPYDEPGRYIAQIQYQRNNTYESTTTAPFTIP